MLFCVFVSLYFVIFAVFGLFFEGKHVVFALFLFLKLVFEKKGGASQKVFKHFTLLFFAGESSSRVCGGKRRNRSSSLVVYPFCFSFGQKQW